MRRLVSAWQSLRVRDFALRAQRCPYCGPSLIVRLRRDETGVRCVRCGASAVHLAIGWALRRYAPRLEASAVCELSARGPLARHLACAARSAALSEYRSDVTPGAERDGVRCEDVQSLRYADASFDLVTHTEVLEHVADDTRAFAELRRVLRSGGLMLFTVPLHEGPTRERARLRHGAIEHLLPAAYHGDPLRGGGAIVVFRDYGADIVTRLLAAGFSGAWIESADAAHGYWGHARAVVCARR
ncbi:MAG: class I SAM-dependent methyltransferase [Proteobacteria bacterium]|nr:class I SAM-dependent methyltransferase [Pseudomonadota bacterium]